MPRVSRLGALLPSRLLFCLFLFSLTACSYSPQSTLDPKSATAAAEYDLLVPIFWAAVVVFVQDRSRISPNPHQRDRSDPRRLGRRAT